MAWGDELVRKIDLDLRLSDLEIGLGAKPSVGTGL